MLNNNLIVGVPIAKENYNKFLYAESIERITDKMARNIIEYLLYAGVPTDNLNHVLLRALKINDERIYRNILKDKKNNKCSICGSKKNLTVHHITPLRKNKALKYRNSNLLTVCNECHKQIHNYE